MTDGGRHDEYEITPRYGHFRVLGSDGSVYGVDTETFEPALRLSAPDRPWRDFVSVVSLGPSVTGSDPAACADAAQADPESHLNVLRVGYRHLYRAEGKDPTLFLQAACERIESGRSSAIEYLPSRVVVAPVEANYLLDFDSGGFIVVTSTAYGTPLARVVPPVNQRAQELDGLELPLLDVVAVPEDSTKQIDPGFFYPGLRHWLFLRVSSTARSMLVPAAHSIHRLPARNRREDQP